MNQVFYTQEAWEQAAKALETISTTQDYLVTPSVTPIETMPIPADSCISLDNKMAVPIALNSAMDKARKVFKCPTKNCSKVYKNSNGLKYHLEKGTCVASRGLSPDSSPGSVSQHLDKPFYCKLGCIKYYRNINGLKYHARIEHALLDFERDVKGVVRADLVILMFRLMVICRSSFYYLNCGFY